MKTKTVEPAYMLFLAIAFDILAELILAIMRLVNPSRRIRVRI